jgi:hypothetical protein
MNYLEQQFESQNYPGFISYSIELLKKEETFEAYRQICEVFVKYYHSGNAGLIADILEAIFLENKDLINNLKNIENPLILLCIFTGSEAIYSKYCKFYLDPLISNLDEYEVSDYYVKLYDHFEKTNDILFNNCQKVAKGKDYHGKMSAINDNPDFVMLMAKDYDRMEIIIENYNKIIGRSIIFKDISKRLESC